LLFLASIVRLVGGFANTEAERPFPLPVAPWQTAQ